MRFKDKVAVVTGAASGIGLATAKLLASEGATVAVADLHDAPTQAAVAAIEAEGGAAIALPGDVSDDAVVRACAAAVVERLGRIDILVNNAGIAVQSPAEEHDIWDKVIATNLSSQFYWARAAASASMIANRSGAIVNIGSTVSFAGMPHAVAYVASKHGVVGLTRALAVDWAPYNIRVNCVAPGITESALTVPKDDAGRAWLARRSARIPLGRLSRADEQARAIAWLASDEAGYVTGLIMNNDGGQNALSSGYPLGS